MNAPRPRRILVVEDESMLLDVVSADLEEAGFEVAQALTAESALDILQGAGSEGARAIDVLFTDIRLPGAMDGWQLAEAARALHPNLPIIYATGFTQEPPRLAAGSLFFTKPYRSAAIVRAIRSLTGPGA